MFDPIALKAWYSDENNDLLLKTELENYFQNYLLCFSQQPQRRAFQTFIQWLLSPLEQKSIEPIALHFSREKYVRPLQQFFIRSPFDQQPLLDTYQQLLFRQIGGSAGMLSVDDTSFMKKGKQSVGVKRQYCGRLGKTKNCQSGVFLAYAGDKGYGLVDYKLYIPQQWFSDEFAQLREEYHVPERITFSSKNEIAWCMINQVIGNQQYQIQWVGCDVAYGNDHAFLDGFELPKGIWYFAATNAKEQVFLEYPEMIFPKTKSGCPRKHPMLSHNPISMRDIAEDPSFSWKTVVLVEGAKEPILAERKCARCFSSRANGSRNYLKPRS